MWSDAVSSYQAAVALSPDEAYWQYRLGFAQERLQNLQGAADSYKAAIEASETRKPYWLFRLAYVLQEMGRFEEAAESYIAASGLTTLEQDFGDSTGSQATHVQDRLVGLVRQLAGSVRSKLDAKSFFDVGVDAEKVGDWLVAADLYSQAVQRSDDHRPAWYNRLGHALVKSGQLESACDAFRLSRVFARPYGVSEQGYSKNAAVKTVIEYVEYYETLPIVKGTVLYETNLASSIDCNPLAIYENIVDDPKYSTSFISRL